MRKLVYPTNSIPSCHSNQDLTLSNYIKVYTRCYATCNWNVTQTHPHSCVVTICQPCLCSHLPTTSMPTPLFKFSCAAYAKMRRCTNWSVTNLQLSAMQIKHEREESIQDVTPSLSFRGEKHKWEGSIQEVINSLFLRIFQGECSPMENWQLIILFLKNNYLVLFNFLRAPFYCLNIFL